MCGVEPSEQGFAHAVNNDSAYPAHGRVEMLQGLGHGVRFLVSCCFLLLLQTFTDGGRDERERYFARLVSVLDASRSA